MSDIRDDELDPDVERASEIDHVTDVTDVADASDVADVAEVADTGTESDLEQVIEHDLESLLAERDQFRDIALRLQADFENYRKRVAQQSAEEVVRASARLAEALLPVLDAAEAAYVRHPDEIGPLLNVMLAELRKQGLGTLDLLDQPFDPTVADAVAHQPGEGGDVVVAEVLRSGYTWQGRTLRPAMVRTRD
jgi:molecular chaperone GrpE